jgi:hypothetical protein
MVLTRAIIKATATPKRISNTASPSVPSGYTGNITLHEQTAPLSVFHTLFHHCLQHHRFHGDTAIGYADNQRDFLQGHRLAGYSGIMVHCLHESQQVSRSHPRWAPQS